MKNTEKKNIGLSGFTVVIIYVICYLSYLTVYLSRQNISVATPELKEQGIMSALQIGTLGTVFSIVYSLGRLVNGRIGDKVKPKYMLSAGLLLICISNVCFGLFLPFWAEIIFWGINAIGQSMLWGPILRVFAVILPDKKRTVLMSLMATSISMGTVTGILLCTGMISFKGVSYAFFAPAAIAMIFAILCFLVVGKVKTETKPVEAEKPKSLSFKDIIKNKLLLSMLIPTLIQGVMKENINLWLSLFFVTKFNINLEDSLVFAFAIPLIGAVGRLIYPLIYKAVGKNENKVNIIAYLVCIIASAPIMFIPDGDNSHIMLIILSSLCLGIISACISIMNHSYLTMVPLRFSKYNSSSTSAGIIDFMSYIGAAAGSIIYGWIFDQGMSFAWMFGSWIVISAIAIVLHYISDKKGVLSA